MSEIFEKNMVALARVNLALMEALMLTKSNKRYEVVIGKSPDEINLFDKENNFEPMYKSLPSQALYEKLVFLEGNCQYPYFYFFGMGNGLLYKVMCSEFKQLKKIFVFEPSLEILLVALTLVDFSEEIESHKIFFINATNFTFENANDILNDFHTLIFSKVYTLHLHSDYYDCFSDESLHVNSMLVKSIQHSVYTLGNCAVDSLIGLQHHLKNLPLVVQTPTLDELVDKGKNSEIVIIASTGPSLSKQLPLLKKIQQHVTIICPDASFPVLSQHGIVPDIVFSMERIEATAKFFEETPRKFHKKPLFALTSIADQKVIASIKSKNIQMSIRPFHYLSHFNTPSWGYLGFGMSAANMAFDFVMLARFSYCVFIGQDLAFGSDGATHTAGHIFGSNDANREHNLLLDAYGGSGKVESTPIWKAFLTYFEQDIQGSQSFIKTFNCTEGGARINGAIELPFDIFIKQYVDMKYKKKKIVLQKPSAREIAKAVKNYTKQFVYMESYIQKKKSKIETLFLELMKFLEKAEYYHKKNQLEKIDFTKVDSLILKIENIKNFFKESLFEAVVFDFLKSYIISQERDIAKLQVRIVRNEEEEKAKKLEWLYVHRFWLFSLAGGMEAILNTLAKSTLKKRLT